MQIVVGEDASCKILCRRVQKKKEIHLLDEVIEEEYRVHWLLDNLPIGVRNSEQDILYRGFPVGLTLETQSSKKKEHYLYNHVRIVIRYSEGADFSGVRIVGFEVVPFSIKVS